MASTAHRFQGWVQFFGWASKAFTSKYLEETYTTFRPGKGFTQSIGRTSWLKSLPTGSGPYVMDGAFEVGAVKKLRFKKVIVDHSNV